MAQLLSGFMVALAVLGALGSAVGLVFGLMQSLHPAMDSFSHFRIHLAVTLALSCLILCVLCRGRPRWIALLCVILISGWSFLEFRKGPPEEGPRGDLRIVQYNLNYRNGAMDRVAGALTAYDADIITLQEVPPDHEAVLRGITDYPHQTHCFFRKYIGGVSILSKHPLSEIDCAEGEGMVLASVDAPRGAVAVASIHTYWPWPLGQHGQIDAWLPRLAKMDGPAIVAGDFNAAPWSHAVSKVTKASRTKVVPGMRMTIKVMGIPIPIDHVLLSDDLCASSASVEPTIGSDHFPVVVEIERGEAADCAAL